MLGGGVALIFLSGPGRYEGQSSPLSFYVPRSSYTICAHGTLPPLRVINPGTVEDRQSRGLSARFHPNTSAFFFPTPSACSHENQSFEMSLRKTTNVAAPSRFSPICFLRRLALSRNLRHASKHGQVAPAHWTILH